MKVLLSGLGLFVAVLLLSTVAWRLLRLTRGITALLALFFGVLAIALTLNSPIRAWTGLSPLEFLHAGFLYASLALAYAVLFSAIAEDSPSATIVKFTFLAGEAGRHPDEFRTIVTDDLIVTSRFDSLVRSGALRPQGGRYVLSAQGLFWARLFRFLHAFFRLPGRG